MSEFDDHFWSAAQRVARDWLGASAHLDELRFLGGGSASSTCALRLRGGERAVLKLAAHRSEACVQREVDALRRMADLGLPVPRVWASGVATFDRPHRYLLVEYVPGLTLRELRAEQPGASLDDLERELAAIVATLHAQCGESYGRVGEAEASGDWCAVYGAMVEPACRAAEAFGCLPVKTRKTIGRAHASLDRLVSHDDCPRLCHGDLWGGNVLCDVDPDGTWHVRALIDPDLRHGHAEAEIAYLDLFHTIGPAFKQAYQKHFRLADAYHARRKLVYQLFALINQLQLHGPSHAAPVIATAARVAAFV